DDRAHGTTDGRTDGSADMAGVAALLGDRARAAMLLALMDGRALTATELAAAAHVTKQTASAHLGRLSRARLIVAERQGRHCYVRLAGRDVAQAIERLLALAGTPRVPRVAAGPADAALRRARVCYDHLAGTLGVQVYTAMRARGALRAIDGGVALTAAGDALVTAFGIDLDALRRGRRPLCLRCLDWSERRPHLAGALGAAILERCLALGWARRARTGRAVLFTAAGELALRRRFR
ncbi:MAG TPA: helix-turn-helix transcriptional regulator, partial [Gemmatimonadaceae bacterium]|nr:helix-turn-helix transcriptional regulator [Gemmatimonadaceae bacterium]